MAITVSAKIERNASHKMSIYILVANNKFHKVRANVIMHFVHITEITSVKC